MNTNAQDRVVHRHSCRTRAADTSATVGFFFRGQLSYARQRRCSNCSAGEAPQDAIARSVARRVAADVSLTWSERGDDGHDTYTAAWFDAASDTFQQAAVRF